MRNVCACVRTENLKALVGFLNKKCEIESFSYQAIYNKMDRIHHRTVIH